MADLAHLVNGVPGDGVEGVANGVQLRLGSNRIVDVRARITISGQATGICILECI